MHRCARLSLLRDSRFCKRFSRFRTCGLGAAVLWLALAVSGAAYAAPEDDYQRGAQAFRAGDVVSAMAALRRAADAGHAPAQALLGSILDQAEFDAEALDWFRKAAEQGDPGGEYGVGAMYFAGEGVKQDLAQAYFWFTRAAEKKHEQAIVTLANAYLRFEKGEIPLGPDKARAAEWLRKAADLDNLAALEALAKAYRTGGFGLAQDAGQAQKYAARAESIRKKMVMDKGKKKR